LTPVFDAILEKAHSLCGAAHGSLMTFDGEFFRGVATRGLPDSMAEFLRGGFPVYPGSPHDRLMRGERFVQISDRAAQVAESPPALAAIETCFNRLHEASLWKTRRNSIAAALREAS